MIIQHNGESIFGKITISGSKSETNRWLILQKLYPNAIELHNLSSSEDSKVISYALNTDSYEKYIHYAGAALRFLTAYFAFQSNKKVKLFGSERLHQRPIAPLVDALNQMGCSIKYLEKHGFAPLEISGKIPESNVISINASLSSQFVTALCLVAPTLPYGLILNFTGKIPSLPYLSMSLKILERLGISYERNDNSLTIFPQKNPIKAKVTIESDWSSASYFYSISAIAKEAEIELQSFTHNSMQGDAILPSIYETNFGVNTQFLGSTIVLKKQSDFKFPAKIDLNLNSSPDIAQTIAVTAAALQIPTLLSGLETLQHKETERITALKTELEKLGVRCIATPSTLELQAFSQLPERAQIETYHDHRMAMAFAPFALRLPLEFQQPEVVEKSYPEFWEDLQSLDFQME